jgi:hypothetical protein
MVYPMVARHLQKILTLKAIINSLHGLLLESGLKKRKHTPNAVKATRTAMVVIIASIKPTFY